MGKQIYQLKININDSKPSIWRRILVYSDTLMPDLHRIIQTTMGWDNYHLHQFVHGNKFYAPPSEDETDEFDAVDYQKVKLSSLLKKEKDKMEYEYDFNDGWEHIIELEKITDIDTNKRYPICIEGEQKCPPEDCGGIWGYMEMLDILKDKTHEGYEQCLEWVGDDFDASELNIKTINEKLASKDYGCVDMW